MKLNKYITGLMLGSLAFSTSCSDFLDTAPDTRTEITDVESARMLLVDAYASANYGVVGEMYSDNMVDNNAPHEVELQGGKKDTVYYNLAEWDKMYNELFAFEPTTLSTSDSPASVWSDYYRAIAVVNHALENLDRIEAEGNLTTEEQAKAKAVRGEALVSRAYHHFILVNIFSQAYKSPEASKMDIGVTYMTKPETELVVHYDRGTVAETYKRIEEDLLAGLPLINDSYYKVPKYHFNKNAAYAFAVRYYLFTRNYDKVIEYANKILGDTPGVVNGGLRDYRGFEGKNLVDDAINEWINVLSPSNLMLQITYSTQLRSFATGCRYALNHSGSAGTVGNAGPTWNLTLHPTFLSTGLLVNGKADYGMLSLKVGEKFEYTDKTSGIGYPHVIRMEFTKEEVLLSRAEAYIMKNDFTSAVLDMKAWDDNMKNLAQDYSKYYNELTDQVIKDFYNEDTKSKYYDIAKYNLLNYEHTQEWSGDPTFVVTAEQKPYLNCCLHFRRLESIHNGMRFFDLKRYAIEWSHDIGKAPGVRKPARTETLTWDDVRRAVEVPQDAIAMGLASSYTKLTEPDNSAYVMVSKDNVEEVNVE